METIMADKGGKIRDRIEVKTREGEDKVALDLANKLDLMLNSPLFEKIVLETVGDMLIEGKLEYDEVRDVFDTPENNAREFALRWLMELGEL